MKKVIALIMCAPKRACGRSQRESQGRAAVGKLTNIR